MKKINKSFLLIVIIILLSLSAFMPSILINTNLLNTRTKVLNLPSLSAQNKTLLHSYDFESDIVGANPTGITLTVSEPVGSGTVDIDNLGDSQENHVSLHKDGGSQRISMTDNISYYNLDYTAAEFRCMVYHDTSLFGILFWDSDGVLFRLDMWNARAGRYSSITYTRHTLNEWIPLVIYFDITRGWMFDLEGERYGNGYSLEFEHENASKVERIFYCSAFSGGGDGFFRVDDIFFYTVVFTPSEKTIIPGFNIFLLISIICVASILLIKKQKKLNK